MDNNNFLTDEDRKILAVQRRKITIMKKHLQEVQTKLNNLEKQIFSAGQFFI